MLGSGGNQVGRPLPPADRVARHAPQPPVPLVTYEVARANNDTFNFIAAIGGGPRQQQNDVNNNNNNVYSKQGQARWR